MTQNIQLNTQLIFDAINQALREQFAGFAGDLEEATKGESYGYWDDDSGSARDSITAYVPNEQSHDKNFGSDKWAAARSPGYESPVWGNTPENFQPEVHEEEPAEGDNPSIVLTMFVNYAEMLEMGTGSTGKPNPNAPQTSEARPARQERRLSLLANMADNMAADFSRAVEDSIRSTLG